MKIISALLFLTSLLVVAGSASATSPAPGAEIYGVQIKSECSVHIVYLAEKGATTEEVNLPLMFDASVPKKEVLDNVAKYISEKLSDGNAVGFRAECRFARQ